MNNGRGGGSAWSCRRLSSGGGGAARSAGCEQGSPRRRVWSWRRREQMSWPAGGLSLRGGATMSVWISLRITFLSVKLLHGVRPVSSSYASTPIAHLVPKTRRTGCSAGASTSVNARGDCTHPETRRNAQKRAVPVCYVRVFVCMRACACAFVCVEGPTSAPPYQSVWRPPRWSRIISGAM